jgi:hypothetical protein
MYHVPTHYPPPRPWQKLLLRPVLCLLTLSYGGMKLGAYAYPTRVCAFLIHLDFCAAHLHIASQYKSVSGFYNDKMT